MPTRSSLFLWTISPSRNTPTSEQSFKSFSLRDANPAKSSLTGFHNQCSVFDALDRLPGDSFFRRFFKAEALEKAAIPIDKFPDIRLIGRRFGLAAEIDNVTQRLSLRVDYF